MNKVARDIIMNRNKKQDNRDRDYNYHGDYRGNDRSDYHNEYEEDGRRGVKGTGPYGMGGRRYYPDRNDGRDYRDYADEEYTNKEKRMTKPYDWVRDDELYDRRDREDMAMYDMNGMKLKKSDMEKWKHSLMNADGTRGEHFRKENIMQTAEKVGVQYKDYDEMDLCMVVNMLYSDYCEAMRGVIHPEKELMTYVKLAKAWLEDKDAPKGSEKLALYYYCIIEEDEDGENDFRRTRR
jgi:hypothetical protein